jgi:hypothetical protein
MSKAQSLTGSSAGGMGEATPEAWAMDQASPEKKALAPIDAKLVRHTRRCNGRDICSCMLRVESAYFQKNLAEKAAAKKRRVAKTRLLHKVTNLQQLNFELKLHVASFLAPVALGRLGMVRAVRSCIAGHR